MKAKPAKKHQTADQVVLKRVLGDLKEQSDPTLSDADFFERFTAEMILKDYDLSVDELEDGLVGNGGDGGIDSIYLFVNGSYVHEDAELPKVTKGVSIELHIIQSKGSPSFTEASLKNIQDTFEDLFDVSQNLDSHESKYNSDIVQRAERFRTAYLQLVAKKPDISISVYYATHGDEIHTNVLDRAEKLKAKIAKIYTNAKTSVQFVGAKDLVTLFNKVPFNTQQLRTVQMLSSSDGSYVCLASLKDYYEFISDGSKLRREIFEANVRDYQGSVQVNQAIRETLQDKDSENFWFLNNGVTILTPSATGGGNLINIEDPQIVNGLQTSNEIFNHFSDEKNLKSEDGRHILIRIIREDDEKARDRIIRATNSQSNIPAASLRGSDHVHRLIEEFFKSHDLYYDRKKNKYKNEGKPTAKIFSISYLSQAIMSSIMERPDTARARPSSLLNSDAEYRKVFDEKRSPQVYLSAAQLARRIELELKGRFTGTDARKTINNIKWYVMYQFVSSQSKGDPNSYLEALVVANLRSQDFDAAIKTVHTAYKKSGSTDQCAKGPALLAALKAKTK